MSVKLQLASSLGRRDEVPNQELAKKIAEKSDIKAIAELVELLGDKKKDIQSDCIKVLYEAATLKPALVGHYAKEFIALLDNKNNRLQWGAMTALSAIAPLNPKLIFASLAKIIDVADKGSVITRDHCVKILIHFCSIKEYADKAFVLLKEQLLSCPTNQLPMYAENAGPVIGTKHKGQFVKTLSSRLDEIEKESKRKRVEKVIRNTSAA